MAKFPTSPFKFHVPIFSPTIWILSQYQFFPLLTTLPTQNAQSSQRSPLNRPQNPPATHPRPNTIPNTNQNTNQGRNFPEKKPVEFTPILISYVDFLPYLLDNAMVVASPSKILQPPFPRGYNSNVTCAYHGGVLGHSIEHCMTLKHKVQRLIGAGGLRFEEENHLWILMLSGNTMHDAWGNLKVVVRYFQWLIRIFGFMLLL